MLVAHRSPRGSGQGVRRCRRPRPRSPAAAHRPATLPQAALRNEAPSGHWGLRGQSRLQHIVRIAGEQIDPRGTRDSRRDSRETGPRGLGPRNPPVDHLGRPLTQASALLSREGVRSRRPRRASSWRSATCPLAAGTVCSGSRVDGYLHVPRDTAVSIALAVPSLTGGSRSRLGAWPTCLLETPLR